jgi:outer membrane immunogenic protein
LISVEDGLGQIQGINHLKKLLVAVVTAAAFCGAPALAADMAVKAPPPAPAPGYSWTGFYVGGTLGYSSGRDPATDNFSGSTTSDTGTIAPAGAVGGVEAGYNWQMSRWFLGLEADWQATGQDNSFCLDCFPEPGRGIAQKLPWFATVRGRLGYAVGPALVYATGGAAFADVRTTINCCFDGTSVNFNDSKTGWTAGGGIEAALVGNWTAKLEYLYLDLGSTSDTITSPSTVTGTTHVHDNIFRFGLNYRFGAAPYQAAYVPSAMPLKAPVLAPSYSWSGFYLGANLGYSIGRDPTAQSLSGAPNDLINFAPAGVIGGGQLGVNWQINSLVFGLEGDGQWSAQRDTGLIRDFPPTPGFGYQNIEEKIPWFATVRGRLGYAVGPALFYVTGGVAFTQVHTNYSDSNVAAVVSSTSFNNYRTGAAVGGGIETALMGNWTAKAEYLYLDFGNITVAPMLNFSPNPLSTQVRDNVFRLGLNYKFAAFH